MQLRAEAGRGIWETPRLEVGPVDVISNVVVDGVDETSLHQLHNGNSGEELRVGADAELGVVVKLDIEFMRALAKVVLIPKEVAVPDLLCTAVEAPFAWWWVK